MATIPETRRRLLGEGGLHPFLAELIRAVDRLEAAPSPRRLAEVVEARDAYLAMMETDQ